MAGYSGHSRNKLVQVATALSAARASANTALGWQYDPSAEQGSGSRNDVLRLRDPGAPRSRVAVPLRAQRAPTKWRASCRFRAPPAARVAREGSCGACYPAPQEVELRQLTVTVPFIPEAT